MTKQSSPTDASQLSWTTLELQRFINDLNYSEYKSKMLTFIIYGTYMYILEGLKKRWDFRFYELSTREQLINVMLHFKNLMSFDLTTGDSIPLYTFFSIQLFPILGAKLLARHGTLATYKSRPKIEVVRADNLDRVKIIFIWMILLSSWFLLLRISSNHTTHRFGDPLQPSEWGRMTDAHCN